MEEKKMTTNDTSTWVEVFTGASFETEVVKGLLEANGIRCILEDHTMWAVTSHYSGIGGDMRILVTEADKEQATQLINNKD